jgi:hypothetical protein
VGLYLANLRTVATEVLAALSFFNGNVFNSRMPALRRDLLPAARIYTLRDNRVSRSTMNNVSGYIGNADLIIQVVSEANADPAASDLLDLYCEAVELALLSSVDFMCNAELIPSIETVYESNVEGEVRTATATITMTIRYSEYGVTGVPTSIPDQLKTVLLMIDAIDPAADPNTTGHPTDPPDGYPGGYPGPDGRIEIGAAITNLDNPPPP